MVGFALRPYQQDALRECVQAMQREPDVLLQAACGAGKTCIVAALIRWFMGRYPGMSILFLAHREQLIRQGADKLLRVWPEGADSLGLACASVGPVDLEHPVIIGSVQTLANRIDSMCPVQLLIVDEVHRLPPKGSDSQFGHFVSALRERYPTMRLLGVTATPFRLQHGYIFGHDDDWFPRLAYAIGTGELQEEGYLCPLRALSAVPKGFELELSDVRTRGGEYIESEVSDLMCREVFLQAAVDSYLHHGEDRRHVAVFACTIAHAEKLAEKFAAVGPTAVVHSKLPMEDRRESLDAFDRGEIQFLVNVGVLTEGWDCTCVDCVLMVRPTQSTALYVQIVGRGLRLHEGKTDCLLLDLVGNWHRHGDPRTPRVTEPRPARQAASEEEDKPEEEQGDSLCPRCKNPVSPVEWYCPWCGLLLKGEAREPELVEVSGGKPQKERWLVLNKAPRVESYTSKKGNRMLRITAYCSEDGRQLPIKATQYLFFDSAWPGRARKSWVALGGQRPAPASSAEAVARQHELCLDGLKYACIRRSDDGRYYNVTGWSDTDTAPSA